MFTGLIEKTGEIAGVKPTMAGFRLRVSTALSAELKPGDSVAVNGVCLTVVSADAGGFYADVSPETVRVSSLGTFRRGRSGLRCSIPRRSLPSSSEKAPLQSTALV